MTQRGKDATQELYEIMERNAKRRAEALAKAKAEAATKGKEPFDLEALEKLCDTSSDGELAPVEKRRETFEYKYYVRHPEIMTIAEMAELIEELNKW